MTVVGPILRDVVMRVDELPPPSGSVDARELLVRAGGKGADPAIAAVRLGARVAMVGDDEAGAAAVRELAGLRFGLIHRGRRLRVHVRAGDATYELLDGDPLEIRHHGAPLTLRGGDPRTRSVTPAPRRATPAQPPGRKPRRDRRA